MNHILHLAPWVLGIAGILCFGVAIQSFRGKRIVVGSVATLAGLAWLALGGLIVTLSAGLAGYKALTREDVALTVLVTPLAGGKFLADARFPDGRAETWTIAGDQLYVDARILKWKGVANLLGLHTVYELDRIGGRYIDIEQERTAPRSIIALGGPKPFDLFTWIKQKTWMAPLVDAEYGSATFIDVTASAIYEVNVSTTGLLIRKVE